MSNRTGRKPPAPPTPAASAAGSALGPPETWTLKEAGDEAKPLEASDAAGKKHARVAHTAQAQLDAPQGKPAGETWTPPATDGQLATGDAYGPPANRPFNPVEKGVLGTLWGQTRVPHLPLVNRLSSLPLGQWSEVSIHHSAEDLPDGRQQRTRSFDLYLEQPINVPIPSPLVSASVGPIVESTLRCSIKAPKAPGDEQKKGFETADLPVDPDQVRTLAPGTEISLSGFGELGVSATVAVGRTVAVGPIIISASAGPSEQRSKGALFKFELRVGEKPGKVHVRIEHAPLTEHTRSIGAAVGVEGNWDKMNGSLGGLELQVAEVAQSQVDTKVFEKTAFRAARTTTDVHAEPVVQTIDLDLNDPKDRETYRSLIRFAPTAPVNQQDGRRDIHASGVNVQLGPLVPFRSKSLWETDHEEVRTLKGNALQLDQAQSERRTSGIFQHTTRVAVRAQQTKGSGGDDGLLEIQLSREGVKGKELDKLKMFAADLGVEWADAKPPGDDKASKPKKKESEALDLFLTRAGVDKVVAAPADRVLQVYAEQSAKYAKASKPLAWSVPDQRPRAISLIRRWETADQVTQRMIEDEYRAAFRPAGLDTNISRAATELDHADRLAQFTAKLGGDWRRKEFGEVTKALGKDIWPGLATLAQLAGTRNVQIHKLSASGAAATLDAKDQGAPVDGFDRINGVMDPTAASGAEDVVESDDDSDDE